MGTVLYRDPGRKTILTSSRSREAHASRCWWTQATASTGDCRREYAPCFPDWLSVGCEASFIAQYAQRDGMMSLFLTKVK